jgi:hypothetical protein
MGENPGSAGKVLPIAQKTSLTLIVIIKIKDRCWQSVGKPVVRLSGKMWMRPPATEDIGRSIAASTLVHNLSIRVYPHDPQDCQQRQPVP